MKIAYLGIPGSFSFVATTNYFGTAHEYQGTNRFKDIFELVNEDKVDAGIIPVENSLAGSIYENYDLLNQYNLITVVGEYYLRIEHSLLALPGSSASSITEIYSHPKALEQCSLFFERNKSIKQIAATDTAAAAKSVAEVKDTTKGAIANQLAAELYGLTILEKNIEDDTHNYTRFLVIMKQAAAPQDANKCSVVYTLPHTPGSLCKTLQFLADHNLNLTKIESRPIIGKPFEYTFYVDFEFSHEALSHLDAIMSDFRKATRTLKVLGFYKAGKL